MLSELKRLTEFGGPTFRGSTDSGLEGLKLVCRTLQGPWSGLSVHMSVSQMQRWAWSFPGLLVYGDGDRPKAKRGYC